MSSLTHFRSRNVYFYIHYCYSLKVTALDMFQKKKKKKKKNGFTPPLTMSQIRLTENKMPGQNLLNLKKLTRSHNEFDVGSMHGLINKILILIFNTHIFWFRNCQRKHPPSSAGGS